jgi:PncC family amidohydrolase
MAELKPDAVGPDAVLKTAEMLVRRLAESSRTLVLAESCTAGLAADMVARIPGASGVLWGSFVSYTLDAKIAMLGLDRRRLAQYGPVSGETACDMAAGALEKRGAFIAAAMTGLAGPEGDGSGVPLGTVWIATATLRSSPKAVLYHFSGSRNEVRFQAAQTALEELLEVLF